MSFQPNNAFEEKFRQFLAEPGTQDAIRSDQQKEIGIMKKIDEFEKHEELQGQREQLAVALQVRSARTRSSRLGMWNASMHAACVRELLETTLLAPRPSGRQDLDAESQRLIYPILRLKMVQHILFSALKDSRKKGTDFITSIRQKSLIRMLEKVRAPHPHRHV